MDALSEVIKAAQLSGGVFLHAEFRDPWCLSDWLDPSQCGPMLRRERIGALIHYHFVVEGEMRVQVEGEAERVARAGDLILFPRNHPHLLGSNLAAPPVPADSVVQIPAGGQELATIHHGGSGDATRLVCGYLGSDGIEDNPVLNGLPPVIQLSVDDAGSAEWIRSTFQHAADEVARGRPGSETVLAKLSELLFVEAVRRYLEDLPEEQTGWLAGLKDPYVSRVLAMIHADHARPWTVEELGRRVGLSRSALADRFTRMIGQSPIQYLGHWRMQVAAQRLRSTSLPLIQIAEEVGYESEAAFSRAFKKAFGTPPATWRKDA
jgi:AraC-like DNA-binding protein